MTVLKTSLRNFFAHKGRMLLSGVAVVLSVAFVCGTLVFSDTLNTTFDNFFRSTASDVTVSPREEDHAQETGRDDTLPASVADRVRAVDGVAGADGVVSTERVTVVDAAGDDIGSDGAGPTLAGDWGPAARQTMDLAEGREPRAAGEALLDVDAAERAGVSVGDELEIIAVPGRFPVTVTGLVEYRSVNPGQTTVLLEPAAAREGLLGAADAVSEVRVVAADGVSDEELKRRVAAALDGEAVEVLTRAETEAELREQVGFLDVMRYAMLGFAGVAVLVGIFLIVNTFSMLVAQRTREIGLMRALGTSRRQVNRSVLTEALLLGVTASLVGVAAGVGLAVGLMRLMAAMGVRLETSDLTVTPVTPVAGLAVGVLSTVVAAWLPARRAGRVAPMAALREAAGGGVARPGRVRAVLGLLLTGAGAASLLVAAGADEAADGGGPLALGLLLTLVGAIVVGPLLASLVLRLVSAVVLPAFGQVGRMAGRNALRNPRRTGATAAALMIGLALVSGLSVAGESVVASASDQLDRTVGADFVVESGGGQLITPDAEAAVRAVPGLATVTDYRSVSVELTTPDGETTDEAVIAADATYAEDLRTEAVAGDPAAAYRPDHLSVGESFARDHGLAVGDELSARFVGGETATLTLAAITSEDSVLNQGAMYLSVDTAAAYLPPDRMPLNMALFVTAVDGQEDAAYEALRAALATFPQYDVSNQADYKRMLEEEIGALLNIVYGLLALAVIVAVLGVVNTLTLSVVERTREIGLMRAIGLSRRQLRRMIRLESVVIALFGALLGLGLGLAWGVTAQRVMAAAGFDVLAVPWGTIGAVFAGSALVGLLAALLPAFRAGRLNVLRAIATD